MKHIYINTHTTRHILITLIIRANYIYNLFYNNTLSIKASTSFSCKYI